MLDRGVGITPKPARAVLRSHAHGSGKVRRAVAQAESIRMNLGPVTGWCENKNSFAGSTGRGDISSRRFPPCWRNTMFEIPFA